MRLSAIAAILALATPCAAREPPTIITLAGGNGSQSYSGVSSGGEPARYTINSASDRAIIFKFIDLKDACLVEMQRSSRLGYMSEFDRVPAQQIIAAKQGEVFKFSFFQNRAAWIAKTPCSFSFQVE